jgi:hypothetical protein
MSLLEFVPRAEPYTPVISVGTTAEKQQNSAAPREEQGREEPLILFIDGENKGLIDWEISGDGKHGYKDLDYPENLAIADLPIAV